MARVVVSEFMHRAAVDTLRARHEVLYDARLVEEGRRLLAVAPSADALVVRNRTQVRGELLAALTSCKVVGRLGVGYGNIDATGCAERGIEVVTARGASAQSVAEYVIATALRLLRGAYEGSAGMVAGHWPRTALSAGREIGGKTLGLVGFGATGRHTAKLAQGMGMQVIAHEPRPERAQAQGAPRFATLDEAVTRADVLSLHVPLTGATWRLIDAGRIGTMKPGAVLIDTAQGGVVDEVALAAALKSGHLGGAALDVFETEPLPGANAFAGCPNLILTPHIAGLTQEANQRAGVAIAEALLERLSSLSPLGKWPA